MPFTPVPIIEEVLLTILPRLDVADDNLENALDIEFVAEFTFPPALANFCQCFRHADCVITDFWCGFSLHQRKIILPLLVFQAGLTFCPILFPELANCAID